MVCKLDIYHNTRDGNLFREGIPHPLCIPVLKLFAILLSPDDPPGTATAISLSWPFSDGIFTVYVASLSSLHGPIANES